MRIEILLDKRNAVPAHLIQSLEVQLKRRILPLYPDPAVISGYAVPYCAKQPDHD